jgi:hypothetical protein
MLYSYVCCWGQVDGFGLNALSCQGHGAWCKYMFQGVVLQGAKIKTLHFVFVGLAYQCKDIMFRFIIEYSRLRDFGP